MINFLEVQITVHHEAQVSAMVIGVALSSLQVASARMNQQMIQSVSNSRLQLSQEIYEESQRYIKTHGRNLVWIDEIAQGSTKLSTKVIVVVGGIIMGGIGVFGSDAIKESDAYQDAVDWTAEQIDDAIDDLTDRFQGTLHDGLEGNVDIECKRDGTSLMIDIYPGETLTTPSISNADQ